MSHAASALRHLHLGMLRESDVDLLAIERDSTQIGDSCVTRGALALAVIDNPCWSTYSHST